MQCPAKLKTLPNTIATTTTPSMKQDYLPSSPIKLLVQNDKLLFNQIPTDYPKPGETTKIDKTEQIDLSTPLNGGVLVKTIALSIDPYLRGRMRPEDVDTYSPAFAIGKPISNFGIAAVVRSEIRKFRPGDHVYGIFDFQTYSIINSKDASDLKVIKKEESLPWSTYLGILGMPGQTAYVGWKKYLPAMNKKDSDNIKTVIFVSSAAGGVGSMVVQLAKAQGLTIIASAGSDEKVHFAKELGAHIAFNYKTTDTATALKESGLHIDIYWDNVGGEILDAVLPVMNNHGRIIMCGAIAGYNTPDKYGIKNMHEVVSKRLTIHGFIVNDSLKDHISEFFKTFPKMVASGKLKHKEQLYYGFDGAEQAITDIQKGENAAKPVVMLEEEKGPEVAQV